MALIFLLGAVLRFVGLGSQPYNLNRDEAAIGYNAYSLIKTGYDEHGAGPWPLIFKSFGDYKLPGLIYLSALPVKLFGLKTFTVRLPNAFFGSLLILAVYLLGKELKDKQLGLILAVLVALDFMLINNSRSAYEPLVALTWSTLALWALLAARKQPLWLWFSLVTWTIGFYIYSAPLLLSLPLIATTIFLFRKDYRRHYRQLIVFLLLLGLSLVLALKLTGPVNASRYKITIFSAHLDQPVLISKLAGNFLSAFNPVYLFFTGDANPWHNLRNIHLGNLNLFLLPLFLLGLKFARGWPITYLLIATLPNAISLDAPISNRLHDFHLAFLIIAGLGIYQLLQTKNRLLPLIASGYLIFFGYFVYGYFYLFDRNLPGFWQDRLGEAMRQLYKVEDDYGAIYIADSIDSGYIYYVFYNLYPPEQFQQRVVWRGEGGLVSIAKLDKLVFGQIPFEFVQFPLHENRDLIKPYLSVEPPKLLVLDKVGELIPPATYRFIIKDKLGRPLWQAKEISL